MASAFFAVFDDIAILLDDVAAMSKIAAKKTAGILGDDLAVGAEKASGFAAKRELPVLWAITKGSFLNKLIILPLVFLLSALAPYLIPVILVIGGFYLAFEGFEKVAEVVGIIKHHKNKEKCLTESCLTEEKILEIENKKVKSAIVTDFILSLEIIIIALSTVLDKTIPVQIAVTTIIAILATVGVYGLVALLVRMDDTGFWIQRNSKESSFKYKFGGFLVASLPKVIKSLSIIGTIAMILVAGGIFLHNIEFVHHVNEMIPSLWILNDLVAGLIGGFLVFITVEPLSHVYKKVVSK